MHFIFLLFFFSNLSWASFSCDPEVVSALSLLDEGRSMSTHQVQNQGDIGTCYANTASGMLDVALGTPPTQGTSFLQLAFLASFGAKGAGRGRMNTAGGLGFEGGQICTVISAARERGRVCPAAQVTIERDHDRGSFRAQLGEITRSYGNRSLFSSQDTTTLQRFERLIPQLIEEAQLRANLDCQLPRENPSYANAESQIREACLAAGEKLVNNQNELETTPEGRRRRELELEIRELQERINHIGTISVSRISASTFYNCTLSEQTQEHLRDYGRRLERSPENFERNYQRLLSRLRLPATRHRREELVSLLQNDIDLNTPETCSQLRAAALLREEAFVKDRLEQLDEACFNSSEFVLGVVMQTWTASGAVNEDGFDMIQMIDALRLLNRPLDEYLMGMVSPHCGGLVSSSSVNMIEIPENIRCVDHIIPSGNIWTDTLPELTGTAARSRLDNAIKRFQGIVRSALDANRPVGVAVCTGFFRDASNRSTFGRSCAAEGEPHGRHALIVSGYRCRNGQMEYQLQNSWGARHCNNFDESYDCDNSNGTIWIPEETLVENTMRLSVIERE